MYSLYLWNGVNNTLKQWSMRFQRVDGNNPRSKICKHDLDELWFMSMEKYRKFEFSTKDPICSHCFEAILIYFNRIIIYWTAYLFLIIGTINAKICHNEKKIHNCVYALFQAINKLNIVRFWLAIQWLKILII